MFLVPSNPDLAAGVVMYFANVAVWPINIVMANFYAVFQSLVTLRGILQSVIGIDYREIFI